MEYKVELYKKAAGEVPVLDFILSLNPKQQAKIYREIDLLEKFGNELHSPHTKKIEGKRYSLLWELRIEFASDIFRIFYFMYEQNRSILLHGIRKKTRKTPLKELDIALYRMRDYQERKKNGMG